MWAWNLFIDNWDRIQNWSSHYRFIFSYDEANAGQIPRHGHCQHRWSCCTHVSYDSSQIWCILRSKRSIIIRANRIGLQWWLILIWARILEVFFHFQLVHPLWHWHAHVFWIHIWKVVLKGVIQTGVQRWFALEPCETSLQLLELAVALVVPGARNKENKRNRQMKCGLHHKRKLIRALAHWYRVSSHLQGAVHSN